MEEFYAKHHFPVRCNSSFITLIPKVDNPLSIKHYSPICLIGLQFKIISKLLAIRLALVLKEVN